MTPDQKLFVGYALAVLLLVALLALAAVFVRRGARGPSEYQRLRDAGRRARGGGS